MTSSSPSESGERQPFGLRVASIDLVVRELRGVERLSQTYRFDLRCRAPDRAAVEGEELLGAAATLTMSGARGVARVVRGVVSRVRAGAWRGHGAIDVRVVPRLGTLRRNLRSRVFQDMTAPDIMRAVLGSASVACEIMTSRSYAPRPYCVQYQESDLAFVSRLASEEGLFYFFRHPAPGSDASEVVVFGDAAGHYERIADAKLSVQLGGALVGDEHVRTLTRDDRVRAGSMLVRAYDEARPDFDLRGEAEANARASLDEEELERYRHDADANEGVDDGTAQRALDAARARATTASGTSTFAGLTAGGTFEVVDHPDDASNGAYAVTRVEHDGRQGAELGDLSSGGTSYENRFTCVGAHRVARPKKRVRKLEQTVETALVVGPPGEEIYVDAAGRVKVQFPWDVEGKHDEDSSCWLRCMQPWAGASWGFQFIPRVGMEVVVVFVAGDVDRPLVAGAVPNGVNPFTYALPGERTKSGVRTRSSPGGRGSNEITLDDAAGKERVYAHAQKNLDQVIEDDHTRTVKHGESIRVTKDRAIGVEGAHARTAAHGDELKVGDSRTLEIGGDFIRVVNGNEIVEIGKNLIVHAKGKHILQIDGQSGEGQAPAPSVAPPKSSPAPAPSMPAPEKPADEDAAMMRLVWAVEQLPGDLYPTGARLLGVAQHLDQAIVVLESEAAGHAKLFASAPHLLAESSRLGALRVLERSRSIHDALEAAKREAAAAPALRDVDDALAGVLASCRARVAAAEEGARTVFARSTAYLGEARGGGGAGAAQHTWSTNDASSELSFTGGAGVIQATTKLTLAVGDDSTIEITPDCVQIVSPTVHFEGGDGNTITFHGTKIQTDGSTSTKVEAKICVIKGKAIDITSGRKLALKGTSITLNPK